MKENTSTQQPSWSKTAVASSLVAGACLAAVLLGWDTERGLGCYLGRPLGRLGMALLWLLGAVVCLAGFWTTRQQRGRWLVITSGLGLACGLLLCFIAAVQEVKEYRMPMLTSAKLRDLASALREYARVNGRLPPPAIVDRNGRSLLSWRVAILPYLGQEELYQQFHLDESWNSPHNLALVKRMPDVFAPPCRKPAPESYMTCFQVLTGAGTAFEGTGGVSLADFPDGLDKTLLLVEANEAVTWTQPADVEYAKDRPLPAFGHVSERKFFVAFADGANRSILKTASTATIRALITRNGNDVPGDDWE
jgi:hypothetical protein